MVKNSKIKVVKIPSENRAPDLPQVFPPMTRLYLELIENKAKIKQDLVNKEHTPITTVSTTQMPVPIIPSPQKEEFESRLDKLLEDKNEVVEKSDDDDRKEESRDEGKKEDNRKEGEKISEKNDRSETSSFSDDSEGLAERLKELMNNSDTDTDSSRSSRSSVSSNKSVRKSRDKYSKHRDRRGHSVTHARGMAPTLAELEAQGGYVPRRELRDLSQPNATEHEREDLKRELIFKFELLKKSYPGSAIPEFTIHSDYHMMQKTYDMVLKRLSLDSSVDQYKKYLIGLFMGCEFLLGNFMNFDMEGFTQQQIISMGSYEKLLIELGEKSYVPEGSRWPVELRLLFLVIINAGLFIVSKMIMKKSGSNLIGMINNMNIAGRTAGGGTGTRKRRMKGPDINLDDIPDGDSTDNK